MPIPKGKFQAMPKFIAAKAIEIQQETLQFLKSNKEFAFNAEEIAGKLKYPERSIKRQCNILFKHGCLDKRGIYFLFITETFKPIEEKIKED